MSGEKEDGETAVAVATSREHVCIKPRSKAVRLCFGSKNIDKYVLHPNVRDLRMRHIKKLLSALMRGESFEDPLTVNLQEDGSYIIIDGAHRTTAIREWLALFPNGQVFVDARQYTGLNLTQMNEVYRVHATGPKQNLADRLKMERSENEIINKLLSSDFAVPVSVSSRASAWNLPRLLRAYFNRYYPPERTARSSIESFMYAVKLLDHNDYNRLMEFCMLHRQLYGSPGSTNVMCGTGSVTILAKVYYYNVDKIGLDSKMVENRMKHLCGDPIFVQEGKSMDRLIMRRLYDYTVNRMNAKDRNRSIQQIPIGQG